MAQPPKAAAGGTSPCSPFQEAVKEFLQALPKKSKKTSFVVSCMGAAATPEHVHQSIVKVEEAAADKPATRIIRRTLEPIIGVLEDYSGIIDSLCQYILPPALLYTRSFDDLPYWLAVVDAWVRYCRSGGSDADGTGMGVSEGRGRGM